MTVEKIVELMSLQEKAAYLTGKDFWKTKEIENGDIPSFMMCDGPNGLRKQVGEADHLGINDSIKTVCYPTSSAQAASFDVKLAERIGKSLGEECQREQVSMLLGPGLNMKRSPLCGRNFEYYSEDPYLAGSLAAAYVKGLQSKHISACPKHFAANNQEANRMSGNSVVDERTLHEIYLRAFEQVVKEAKPHSIMCAYNQVNGTFMSEHKELLTDVLRNNWGFDGFVVTDWGAGKDAVKGVQAGLDLVMPGGSDNVKNAIISAVEAGLLDENLVDTAVKNILNTMLWSKAGQPKTIEVSSDETRQADYQFAKEVAENSAVLLKNENHLLPLIDTDEIAFIGTFAKKPRYQGSGSSHINSMRTSNAVDAAKDKSVIYAQGYDLKDASKDEELLREAVETAKKVKIAVIFAGLPDAYESEGFDRKTLDMPPNQIKLIEEICKIQENVVVVLHNGSAIMMPWLSKVKAVLEMHLAGDAGGEATVALLYGEANPSGKLAETFPAKLSYTPSYMNFPGVDGCPEYKEGIFIGYRYYDKKELDVLFPFGHGLSYTTFEYSNMKVNKEAITDLDTVEVSVTVRNTGNVFGKEVVQIYVADMESSVPRPEKELKAFEKVALDVGETKVVTFTLDKNAFAYYEVKIHDFFVESGSFTIMAGSSSRDIRETVTIEVEGTIEIPVTFTINSTLGQILASSKGQAVMAPMMQAMGGQHSAQDVDALGEGAAEMQKAMAMEMPLSSLVSFLGLPIEQVNGLVEALNDVKAV